MIILANIAFYEAALQQQDAQNDCSWSGSHLKAQTPPLWMSTALKAMVGSPMATQSSALRMDLCVTTRCEVPSARRISANQGISKV